MPTANEVRLAPSRLGNNPGNSPGNNDMININASGRSNKPRRPICAE